MRSPCLVSAVLFAMVLNATAPFCQAVKLFSVNQEFTMDNYFAKDATDLRDYTPQEIAALRELREIKKSRSFITEALPPKCDFPTWTEGSCCVKFKWQGDKQEACIGAELILKKLLLRVSLLWNEDALFEHDVALARFCMGLPYINKIQACLNIYHLEVNITSTPTFFRVCGQVFLADIIELRLYCFTMRGINVSADRSIEPEETGIFVLSFKNGKMVFEFNNPIPPEVMEVLKNIGAVIKEKVVEFGKKIVEKAKTVWKTVKSWFSWW